MYPLPVPGVEEEGPSAAAASVVAAGSQGPSSTGLEYPAPPGAWALVKLFPRERAPEPPAPPPPTPMESEMPRGAPCIGCAAPACASPRTSTDGARLRGAGTGCAAMGPGPLGGEGNSASVPGLDADGRWG